MNQASTVFESYNKVIETCYDKFLKNIRPNDSLRTFDDEIEDYISISLKKWALEPLKELNGKTPEEYFCSFQSLDLLMDLFKMGSKICHQGLPEPLIKKLGEFGDAAADMLIEIAHDKALIDTDDIDIPLSAIDVLGELKEARAVKPLIDMMVEYEDSSYDIVREHAVDALATIGFPALEQILEKVESMLQNAAPGWAPNNAFQGLNSVLAFIGKDNKSDRIYYHLKNSFAKTGNLFMAACLGVYGDGRAIPFLRGYAEKNIEKIDAGTLYEIKLAVETLGGSMDDIIL